MSVEDNLKESDHNLRLAWVVDERTVSLMIGNHYIRKPLPHSLVGCLKKTTITNDLVLLCDHVEVKI